MEARYLPDRLYELLVDIVDEGPRTLGELRFYAMRSFLPGVPTRAAVVGRLSEWLSQIAASDWLTPTTSWTDVEHCLRDCVRSDFDERRFHEQEFAANEELGALIARRAIEPEGESAWTWPEGWELGWSSLSHS